MYFKITFSYSKETIVLCQYTYGQGRKKWRNLMICTLDGYVYNRVGWKIFYVIKRKLHFRVSSSLLACWQPKQPNQAGRLEFTVPSLRSSLHMGAILEKLKLSNIVDNKNFLLNHTECFLKLMLLKLRIKKVEIRDSCHWKLILKVRFFVLFKRPIIMFIHKVVQ